MAREAQKTAGWSEPAIFSEFHRHVIGTLSVELRIFLAFFVHFYAYSARFDFPR